MPIVKVDFLRTTNGNEEHLCKIHSLGLFRNSVSAKCAMGIMEFGVVKNLKILEFKKDGIPQNV